MKFTPQLLAQVGSSQVADVTRFVDPLNQALERFKITNPVEIAALVGTFALESQRFTKTKEDLYYKDPARLAQIFKSQFDLNKDKAISAEEIERAKPYTRNPEALAVKLYNGFMGRGLGQITWEGNYRVVGQLCGMDFVSNPKLLEQPLEGTLASVAFWVHCDMGSTAADPTATRRKWNGKAMLALDEYKVLFAAAKKALGV